jgi:hypothetical protein
MRWARGGVEEGIACRERRLGINAEPDSLHLAQCNLVLCPVVKLCSAGRFVSGHLLGMLKPSVVFQVNRDTGCPPSMTSDRSEKTRCLWPAGCLFVGDCLRLRVQHIAFFIDAALRKICNLHVA